MYYTDKFKKRSSIFFLITSAVFSHRSMLLKFLLITYKSSSWYFQLLSLQHDGNTKW